MESARCSNITDPTNKYAQSALGPTYKDHQEMVHQITEEDYLDAHETKKDHYNN